MSSSSGEYGQADGAGRLLAGRYRVTARLGRGGMGVVWRAVDEVLGREVAVKELRTYTDSAGPELADLRLRMQREARAAARVRHPGVIAVHDIAEVDGRPLIVMELIDGPSLDDLLRDRGTLDPHEAARVGAEVMDALAAAHRAGVLHRDVKPGNILLDRSGRVVLTDFGIATMDDPGDGSATHLTRSGELVGSLDYLAPERAKGAEPGPASDVWALGATLYAAVEGTSPFRRTSTYSTLTAIVAEPLLEPRRAGPLGPVLRRLMEKWPDSRPDAEEACELLRAVVREPVADTPTTTLREPARPETEAGVPAIPPDFGPAQGLTQGPAHGPGIQGPHQEPEVRGPAPGFGPPPRLAAPTGPMTPTPPPRKGRRAVLLAAAAVAVVLATAGATVAVLNGKGGDITNPDRGQAASASASAGASQSARPSASRHPARPDPTGQGEERTTAPADSAPPTEAGKPTERASATPSVMPSDSTRPSQSPGTGGGPTPPAPACRPIGGGKYNCEVWRTATSYTASGAKAGVLNAGTNYFYCQANLGRRETYGKWTNVWWARTDDDSGNTGVYISDVYIKGGDNDVPVPGLPVC
ncbi:serine/threonine-protein kinase [Streptomyces sp. NPDC005917]|uniref:serine/threonine-protein kinase n=1 Tax=unclassified Streptomyces TaxID=2593676 RepID=UPI0033C7F2C1